MSVGHNLNDGIQVVNDPKRRLGTNVVVLAPDVAQAFPDDQAVNDVLRLVLKTMELSLKYESLVAT